MKKYIEEFGYNEVDHEKRFYILSDDEKIPLPKNPRPKRNNASFTYYRLSDILEKEEVLPASQMKSLPTEEAA